MSKIFDSVSDAHWRQLLRGFSASGLSVKEFCARHGVSPASFYSRRRQLSGSPAASSPLNGPLFVPVRVVDDAPDSMAGVAAASDDVPFTPLPSVSPQGWIELLLDGGVTVRLRGEVPPARLACVLGVLRDKGGVSC